MQVSLGQVLHYPSLSSCPLLFHSSLVDVACVIAMLHPCPHVTRVQHGSHTCNICWFYVDHASSTQATCMPHPSASCECLQAACHQSHQSEQLRAMMPPQPGDEASPSIACSWTHAPAGPRPGGLKPGLCLSTMLHMRSQSNGQHAHALSECRKGMFLTLMSVKRKTPN